MYKLSVYVRGVYDRG